MPSNFDQPWPVRDDVRIREVKAIVTAPQGIPLVVVKIDTTEPGLYGLGCATFTQRWKAVQTFVDEHLARLLIGRYPGDIGDLTRLAGFSGYWRGGPVTNTAISGIDRAVIASSINATGIPFNPHEIRPAYFPLDEKIPVDIGDPYSLSKQNDENTARMAWRRWGIDVVAFRFPHVNSVEVLREFADGARRDPAGGMREAWSYLDQRDAAHAIELGLTAQLSGAHTFFVAADTTNAPYETEALLDAFAPEVPRLRRFIGREVPIDLTAARSVLGFQARHELDLPTLPLEI